MFVCYCSAKINKLYHTIIKSLIINILAIVSKYNLKYAMQDTVMKTEKIEALLIYKEDIENRGFFDWVKAQAAFVDPLHKYKGQLWLDGNYFYFQGTDNQNGLPHKLLFASEQLLSTALSFDTTYRAIEDKSLGFAFKPLRIDVQNGNHHFVCYFIIKFIPIIRLSDNKIWFEKLQEWKKYQSFKKSLTDY